MNSVKVKLYYWRFKAILYFLSVLTLNVVVVACNRSPKVLLVSLDGFRWNYLDKVKKDETPYFHKIIDHGTYAINGIKNVFITKTLPNHYTLVTGLYEESHGLVANTFYDPIFNETFELENQDDVIQSKWFDNGGEPIWVTHQKHSSCSSPRRSGSVFWPGSAAQVKGYLPTKYLPFQPETKNESRIDILISWFLDKDPINLGLLYFEEPDEWGHIFGPESPQMIEMIKGLDNVIGYLLRRLNETGLLDDMNLIITSDHGMTNTSTDKVINLMEYINKTSYKVLMNSNQIVNILPSSEEDAKTIVDSLQGVTGVKIYRKPQIPEQYHYTNNRRILPILLVGDEGYSFIEQESQNISKGNHGYNNSLPDMHPFFMAMGPAFKVNHRHKEIFNNVDVYPLLCHILGIPPAANNGSLDNVMPLLRTKLKKESIDDNTVVIYLVLVVFIGLIGGVYCVGACRQQTFQKRRKPQQQSTLNSVKSHMPYTPALTSDNSHNLPLLSTDTEDEF